MLILSPVSVLTSMPHRLEAKAQGASTFAATSAIDDTTIPDAVTETHNPDTHPDLNGFANPPLISLTPLNESEAIEEIIRDTMPQTEHGFAPTGGYDQEVFDMQLLEDISKLALDQQHSIMAYYTRLQSSCFPTRLKE